MKAASPGLAIVMALPVLLGCLGQPASAQPGAPAAMPGIEVIVHGAGWSFADAAGKTLYFDPNDEKKPGGSTCNAACAETWPPLIAPAQAEPVGYWSTVTRDDGSRQWAYRGKPVYRYVDDPVAGTTFGDNYGKLWHVVREFIPRPAGITIVDTALGKTLADSHGRTLYAAADQQVAADCRGACADDWRFVAAPQAANALGDWTVVDRTDGVRQWAYRGRALFQYQDDVYPREINGAPASKWSPVVLEPPPPRPAWVTYQGTDAGEITADARGMTIYYYMSPRGQPDCHEERTTCITADWKPMIPAPDAKPVGDWTILDLADGTKQWGFRGHRLYSNSLDAVPGDFKGVRRGGNTSFKVLMRNGDPLQGLAGVGG